MPVDPTTRVAEPANPPQTAAPIGRRARIALVAQRYGTEVVGGAESHCRSYAEALAGIHEVDVLTSCALDYTSWENHYPAGVSRLNGVTVHRFEAAARRHPRFDRWWRHWEQRPRTRHDELRWLYEQGPVLPGLLQHIVAHRDAYDLFFFFTYLYFPTAAGMPLVSDRSIFVPTANPGESPLQFGIFRELFHAPRAIVYCTDEEREHCHSLFTNAYVPHAVLGVGVDPVEVGDTDAFARRLGLSGPYLLFLGRIGASKGCDVLLRDFLALRADGVDVHLVFAGTLEMELPRHEAIHHAGVLAGRAKDEALSGALAVMAPSRWDCLSISTCEAWAAARPVLANAASPVVASLVRRSGGGRTYADAAELAACVRQLLVEPSLAASQGRAGKAFVLAEYGAPRVRERLLALVAAQLGELDAGTGHGAGT